MESINHFLAKHNYPPGNSQTLLASHGFKRQVQCDKCKNWFDHLFRAKFISGLVADYCKVCLEQEKQKTTVEKVLGII